MKIEKLREKYPNIHNDEQYTVLRKHLRRRVWFFIYLPVSLGLLCMAPMLLGWGYHILGVVAFILFVGLTCIGGAFSYDPAVIARAKVFSKSHLLTKHEIEATIQKDCCRIIIPSGMGSLFFLVLSVYLLVIKEYGYFALTALFLFEAGLVFFIFLFKFFKKKRMLKNNCFKIYELALSYKGTEDFGSHDSPSHKHVLQFQCNEENVVFSHYPTSSQFHIAEVGDEYFVVVFEENDVVMITKSSECEIAPELDTYLQRKT